MIKADIDDTDLDRAIQILNQTVGILEPEFKVAGDQTVKFLQKDLRGGVGSRTGELRAGIVGELKQVVGANVDMQFGANAVHGGYNYAARLDKDGRMRWRSGRFAGRKTFGWFSHILRRTAPKAARRYFRQAVERIVVQMADKMKIG